MFTCRCFSTGNQYPRHEIYILATYIMFEITVIIICFDSKYCIRIHVLIRDINYDSTKLNQLDRTVERREMCQGTHYRSESDIWRSDVIEYD